MLDNELKKNPFAVPDNYFDGLPSKIQEKRTAAKKRPEFGFIPRLAWAGGIMVLALALFMSYFGNISLFKQQAPDVQTVSAEQEDVASGSAFRKNALKINRNAMADYLAVQNVSLNDYFASRY
ncbi:MAG: hypothetical protein LBQ70_05230 [Prevotellaceae bacterium]|jgi:hypothetical protein|nr:hypothetical protein [Prevotellaceae bacterium]